MSAARTIVLIEDAADLAELIALYLQREGYTCRRQLDGAAGLADVQRDPPDLVLVDRMLPRLSGDEVVARLKRDPRTASIPIIMLTAKAEETDELVGFALGADDYVRKPISLKLLGARVSAVLRRREAATVGEVISAGPIVVDRGRHEVRVDGSVVVLTATEFRLLVALIGARGRVLDRDQLIDAALGDAVGVTHRTIDVHVAALRRKLAAASLWIHTIRGVGYSVREPHGAAAEG